MKNTILRTLSLAGISLMMALSVSAQEPKIKTTEKEDKYKSEDLKIKEKKDELKVKDDQAKIKVKKDEVKIKGDEMKIKEKKDETKIKGKVKPMNVTRTERTTLKTGETQVRVKEHMEAITTETPAPDPVTVEPIPVPAPVKKTPVRKYTARKTTKAKPVVASKPGNVRYITRTKIVRDTVMVPSPPEKIVSTEYVHDTVTVTRVDTVVKVKTQNTYTGYQVPRGEFKKVKLKRDKKDGDVWMKRKDKDGKVKADKLEH